MTEPYEYSDETKGLILQVVREVILNPNATSEDREAAYLSVADSLNFDVRSELALAPPAVCEALSDLISIVELLPDAQDPSTELWASVFTARESLRYERGEA